LLTLSPFEIENKESYVMFLESLRRTAQKQTKKEVKQSSMFENADNMAFTNKP
jgi:hypothetical protein